MVNFSFIFLNPLNYYIAKIKSHWQEMLFILLFYWNYITKSKIEKQKFYALSELPEIHVSHANEKKKNVKKVDHC